MSDRARTVATEILLDETQKWTSESVGSARLYFPSFRPRPDLLLQRFSIAGVLTHEQLHSEVNQMEVGSALIYEDDNIVFAAVDRVRSIPVFYQKTNFQWGISNSNHSFRAQTASIKWRPESVLQMKMSGFVFGKYTLLENVYQLIPGSFISIEKSSGKGLVRSYYTYLPSPGKITDVSECIQKLDEILNRDIERIGNRANGRPILVPLSGGLDSRLIVCKLTELGVPNVRAISYGPANNHEAKCAREVATRLNIPWKQVSPTFRGVREHFASQIRVDYWDFAHGHCSVPTMNEAEVFSKMISLQDIEPGTVVLNGQSGDFITGGHVPRALLGSGTVFEDFVREILDNHCSLWTDMLTSSNVADLTTELSRFVSSLETSNGAINHSWPAIYELWEWQERQSKYVVNGQRLYDFLELDWELPLWTNSIMDFWAEIPFEHKLDQNLFLSYLKWYDYRGLFEQAKPEYKPRTTTGLFFAPIHLVSAGMRILKLHKMNRAYLRVMRYFSYYWPQYATIPFRKFLRESTSHRNPVSYFSEQLISDLANDRA